MKRCRLKVVGTVILLFVIMVFTGCEKDDEILFKHDERTVSVYSSITCSVNIYVDITENKKVSRVSKKVDLKAGEVQNLKIEDFVAGYFSAQARITDIRVKETENNLISTVFTWLPWVLLLLIIIYNTFKQPRKKNKST